MIKILDFVAITLYTSEGGPQPETFATLGFFDGEQQTAALRVKLDELPTGAKVDDVLELTYAGIGSSLQS